MKITRRQFLDLTAGAVVLFPGPWQAWAQTYPVRPVILSVGLAAGGGTDLVARLVAEWLSRMPASVNAAVSTTVPPSLEHPQSAALPLRNSI